ncbi:hypothetical protein DER53_11470 [Parageobacillus toebii NBRC 107807]|uniref:Uncharacterized protein n=2 Tax=Parageobacillus toebii TaxID=153151 RepID=A0A6G9J3Q3_9BACL|nr:hypothetical protein [Parageobacillus toebii]KYD24777.1 hypothetical protein B4110_1560 [Parageobacillus toebii]MBB3869776.1 hypothetical protein [Parageobacillus toebii NBRC 107807]QIQ33321.1 hypothetical protein DER53_11470 [Parageobacillus toebii NBRC 107807]
MSETKEILPITIYLNQKIVFDLLAVIDDGFSQVTKLNISNQEGKKNGVDGSAEIGISNAFGLFGVKSKINARKEKTQTESTSKSEEKVHTPTSLFVKLLSYLEEKNLVKDINDKNDLINLKPGEFVRFNSTLEQNPLVSLLESLEQMAVMAIRLENKKKNKAQSEDQNILKLIKGVRESLTQHDMIDLISTIKNSHETIKAVLPVYINFFFNRSMNEIIDGNYTVVGKVAKVVLDQNDNINLFRNTGFKLLKQHTLEKMFTSFNDQADEQLELPEIITRINEPALLVIPIAIYS